MPDRLFCLPNTHLLFSLINRLQISFQIVVFPAKKNFLRFLCILKRLLDIILAMETKMKVLGISGKVFCFLFFFHVLGLYLWHMEIPRLGVESELQLPFYATATAMQDPSHICDLYHSSQQCWIPNPLSEAGDRTLILMDARWICFRCATTGTPGSLELLTTFFQSPSPQPSLW